MNRCIYLPGVFGELKYKGEEHIIPAGLGGILKLPKGYVSDEANNMFSKYELQVMRHSLLTGNRMRHGPGKRGNQNVDKQKKHVIQLLKDETSGYEQLLLGYVFSGKTYIMPQISCNIDFINNSVSVNYVIDNYQVDDYAGFLLEFKTKLHEFLFDKKRSFHFIKDEFKENKDMVTIGFHKNKWYISSSMPLFDINTIAGIVLDYSFSNLLLPKERLWKQNINEIGKTEFSHRRPIDITGNSFGFIFTKTAFNALAYLKGQDFALLSIFDELRKDVIECNSMTPYIIPNTIHDTIFANHIEEIPENAHCVYIVSDDNMIYAYVAMYNEWHAHIVLTEKYSGDKIVTGFVCDWKKKNEYKIK